MRKSLSLHKLNAASCLRLSDSVTSDDISEGLPVWARTKWVKFWRISWSENLIWPCLLPHFLAIARCLPLCLLILVPRPGHQFVGLGAAFDHAGLDPSGGNKGSHLFLQLIFDIKMVRFIASYKPISLFLPVRQSLSWAQPNGLRTGVVLHTFVVNIKNVLLWRFFYYSFDI
mgnify:CR=1 FL=1